MKIEAKKIQTMRSHDGGEAWSASIYLDGKIVGHVIEDGWGGALQVDINKEDCQRIEAHMETLPGVDTKGGEALECFLSELVCLTLDTRELKRKLKKPLAIDPNVPGALYTFGKAIWKHHAEMLKKKNPTFRFLNEMPFDEALAIYSPPVPPLAEDGGPGKVK